VLLFERFSIYIETPILSLARNIKCFKAHN